MLEKYIQEFIKLRVMEDEATIRDLLGRWVSGLEPAVAYRDGEIIGLTLADAEIGSRPYILRL
jgi:hypothetical protein